MKNNFYIMIFFVLTGFVLSSCMRDDDDVTKPINPNEAELITTMKLIITESGNSSNIVEAVFRDIDGDGGAAPSVFDTIRLSASKTYTVEILLLDESKTPTDTISQEVEEEGDKHQFFFSTSGGANVNFTYSDADVNGVPIGLSTQWTTGAATTNKNGKVKVSLKHQGADKPKSGSGNTAIGETDIELDFPVIVQ